MVGTPESAKVRPRPFTGADGWVTCWCVGHACYLFPPTIACTAPILDPEVSQRTESRGLNRVRADHKRPGPLAPILTSNEHLRMEQVNEKKTIEGARRKTAQKAFQRDLRFRIQVAVGLRS